MKNWQFLSGNQELKKKLLMREKVIDSIRAFFKEDGFHEVETPLLVQHPGTEPYLEVFETELRTPEYGSNRAFLTTSPELAMKKLLSSGFGNIFQICKSFRNDEGISSYHNHEFTILEWYRVDADYTDIMHDMERLILYIHQQVGGKNDTLTYQGKTYDLSAPFWRISVAEAFEMYAGIDEETMLSEEKLTAAAKEKGYTATEADTWEEAYNQIFLNEIESHLGHDKPTILYDYPASQAALSKKKRHNQRYAERFEVYLAGLELGNAFSELTEPLEQRDRMLAELKERQRMGKTDFGLDEDFLLALENGMPETGGIAVGVDRLVMLFADAESVKETLLFPIEDVFDF